MCRVQKLMNIILIAVVALSLFGVLGYEVVKRVPITEQNAKSSDLEQRNYQTLPKPTLKSIAEGQFQTEFSKFVSDNIPYRNGFVIANAYVQRAEIELASLPFGYDTYPTFFGSKHVFTPATNRVSAVPDSIEDRSAESLKAAANAWSSLIDAFPQIHWYAYLPERAEISQDNPAYALTTNHADKAFWEENFFSHLPDSVHYVANPADIGESWDGQFFNTDHHWQIQGAYAAYLALAEAMGFEPIGDVSFYKADTSEFWGSFARAGLCFEGPGDTIWDIDYDVSDLKVAFNDEDKDMTDLDRGICDHSATYKGSSKYANLYARWFHTDYGLITIENPAAASDKTLLIFGDSFSNNCERLYAEEFKTVYVMDLRYYKENPYSFIESHGIDDALLLMSYALENSSALEKLNAH